MVEQVNVQRGPSQISLDGNRNGSYRVKLSFSPFNEKFIGKIVLTPDGNRYEKRIKPEVHTFNKANAVGFPYELLKHPPVDFRWIRVFIGDKILETTRDFVLEHGTVRRFGNYELQAFLDMESFGKFKAIAFEMQSKAAQTELFPSLP